MNITVRHATAEDSDDILAWRNDPLTRAMSLGAGEVARDRHVEWFASALRDRNRFIYVAEGNGTKIGMCRFDLDDRRTQATISIHLNPAERGKRLSYPLLEKSIAHLFEEVGPILLLADIKEQNTASIKCFEANGFELVSRREGLLKYRRIPESKRGASTS